MMNMWKILLLTGFLQVAQVSYAEQNQDSANKQVKEDTSEQDKHEVKPNNSEPTKAKKANPHKHMGKKFISRRPHHVVKEHQ